MMAMKRRLSYLGVVCLIAMLIVSSMAVMNVVGPETVEYTLSFTDPEGDPEGTIVTDEATEDNADILKITSAKEGDNIVLTMTVKGYINTSNMTTYQNGYQFNLDINGDEAYDWLVTSSYMGNYGGTDSQLQDDEGSFNNLHYLENATGIGTHKITVKFALSFITDFENITSWDMYATSSSVKSSTFASYADTAPDDGFTGGGLDPEGDEDGDGMKNGWESDNGLDPNDPSDANGDPDADGYTNKEEYLADTDPQDSNDHPTGPPPPPANGTQLGPFKSADDKPIDDATVKISPAWSAETDENGYATFSEYIEKGTYTCTVEKDGKTIIESFSITIAEDGTVTYAGTGTPPQSKLNSDEIEGEEDDDNGSPGFEAFIFLSAMVTVLALVAIRRRKRF